MECERLPKQPRRSSHFLQCCRNEECNQHIANNTTKIDTKSSENAVGASRFSRSPSRKSLKCKKNELNGIENKSFNTIHHKPTTKRCPKCVSSAAKCQNDFPVRNVQRVQILKLSPAFFLNSRADSNFSTNSKPIPTLGNIYRSELNENDRFNDWLLDPVTNNISLENSISEYQSSRDTLGSCLNDSRNILESIHNIRIPCTLYERESPSVIFGKINLSNVTTWLQTEMDSVIQNDDMETKKITKLSNSVKSNYKKIQDTETIKKRVNEIKIDKSLDIAAIKTESCVENGKVELIEFAKHCENHEVDYIPVKDMTAKINPQEFGLACDIFPKVERGVDPLKICYSEFNKHVQFPIIEINNVETVIRKKMAPSFVECPSEILHKTTNYEDDGKGKVFSNSISSLAATDFEIRDAFSNQFIEHTDDFYVDENAILNSTENEQSNDLSGEDSVGSSAGPETNPYSVQDIHDMDSKTLSQEPGRCKYSTCDLRTIENSRKNYSHFDDKINHCKKCKRFEESRYYKYKYTKPSICFRNRFSIRGVCRKKWQHIFKYSLKKKTTTNRSQIEHQKFRKAVCCRQSLLWEDADVQTVQNQLKDTATDAVTISRRSACISTSSRILKNNIKRSSSSSRPLPRINRTYLTRVNLGPSLFLLPDKPFPKKPVTGEKPLPKTGASPFCSGRSQAVTVNRGSILKKIKSKFDFKKKEFKKMARLLTVATSDTRNLSDIGTSYELFSVISQDVETNNSDFGVNVEAGVHVYISNVDQNCIMTDTIDSDLIIKKILEDKSMIANDPIENKEKLKSLEEFEVQANLKRSVANVATCVTTRSDVSIPVTSIHNTNLYKLEMNSPDTSTMATFNFVCAATSDTRKLADTGACTSAIESSDSEPEVLQTSILIGTGPSFEELPTKKSFGVGSYFGYNSLCTAGTETVMPVNKSVAISLKSKIQINHVAVNTGDTSVIKISERTNSCRELGRKGGKSDFSIQPEHSLKVLSYYDSLIEDKENLSADTHNLKLQTSDKHNENNILVKLSRHRKVKSFHSGGERFDGVLDSILPKSMSVTVIGSDKSHQNAALSSKLDAAKWITEYLNKDENVPTISPERPTVSTKTLVVCSKCSDKTGKVLRSKADIEVQMNPSVCDAVTNNSSRCLRKQISASAYTSHLVLPRPSPRHVLLKHEENYYERCRAHSKDSTARSRVHKTKQSLRSMHHVLSPKAYKAIYDTTRHLSKLPIRKIKQLAESSSSNIKTENSFHSPVERNSAIYVSTAHKRCTRRKRKKVECRCPKVPTMQDLKNIFPHGIPSRPSSVILPDEECLVQTNCYHAKILDLPSNTSFEEIEENTSHDLLSSCRYYSKLLMKHFGVTTACICENQVCHIPLSTDDSAHQLTEIHSYPIIVDNTQKPKGSAEQESCSRAEILQPSNCGSCLLSRATSLTNICCEHDKECLKSVYILLSAIEGRVRRIKRHLIYQ